MKFIARKGVGWRTHVEDDRKDINDSDKHKTGLVDASC